MNPFLLIHLRRVSAWLLAALGCVTPLHAAVRKPNFLFVYTDDQRWDAMGLVQREQGERARFPWFKSPNMDRLASQGVRFRNAFVTCSLCAPSRAAFLTGRYNHRNGITNNHTEFPADSVTHATLLRAAGYQTAYIGKWHMGEQRGQRPGFDYSASFVGHGRYQDCPIEINGVATPTKGWLDDVSTDFAIDWMKQNRDRPFAMVVGLKSPHSPRGGKNLPERLRNLYAGESSRPTPNLGVPPIFSALDPATGKQPQGLVVNETHLDYFRHMTGADENLGRLLDSLDQLGLTEDTVVVYSSDNGYYLGEHCSGDKRSIYEESLRVPMLVRYPRLFGKGKVVDEMVLNIDLAPTFLDLAGVAAPSGMQGVSWKALAAGGKPANWRQSFLAEYFFENGGGNTPTLIGVRTAKAKLVTYPGHPEWTEVFDLTVDPYELKNLAGDSAVTAKLKEDLDLQMKAMDYVVPAKVDKPRAPDPVLQPIKDEAGLPRVLLIGDSISMGYTLPVRELLKGKANLHRIPTNGSATKDGLVGIDYWLGDGKWDVIHFNWGLHDLKHWKDGAADVAGPPRTTPEEYETQLRTLVKRMRATGAKLIWATTTPVPEGSAARIAGEEVKYNEVAGRVMKDSGVVTNDLHALCLPKLAEWQLPNNVHFKEDGSAGLAVKVAAAIEAALGGRQSVPASNKDAQAVPQAPTAQQEEFLKLKFGMFIHFNMETFKGVQWVSGYPSPADFNPGGPVDTDAWADAALAAGMKYAVLTAKHVGGFCLWDSKHTTYDIMNPDCPYKQDLVAQFIKSFKSRGLKVGLYYCWRNREFQSQYKVLPPECDPATHAFAEQVEFAKKQIAELVEKYPDAFCIWNDGLDAGIMPVADANAFYRGLGRDVLAIANWCDWAKKGTPFLDIAVKEMREFPAANSYPGETCWCLEGGWFWQEGAKPKTAKQVVELLATANSRHSNFLLNVGPNKQGKFEAASVTVLAEIGKQLNAGAAGK